MRSIPLQFDDGSTRSLSIHRNLTVAGLAPEQWGTLRATLPAEAVVVAVDEIPVLDPERRARATEDAKSARSAADEHLERCRDEANRATAHRSDAAHDVATAKRHRSAAIDQAREAGADVSREEADLVHARSVRDDLLAELARAERGIEAAAVLRRDTASRIEAAPKLEDDPAVKDAHGAIRRSEALLDQLGEILAAGDLSDDVRAAIDAPGTREEYLAQYGFDSFLEYSIAISTGALTSFAQRKLDAVETQLSEQRDALGHTRLAASSRAEAWRDELEATVARAERDASSEEDRCRGALEVAERSVLDAEQALTRAREAAARAALHEAAADDALAAAMTTHARTESEARETAAGLAAALDALAECDAQLREITGTGLTSTETDEQLAALRARVDANGAPNPALFVLLDAWHTFDPVDVIALLDRVADREVPARVLYVTDDEAVLAWARRLRRWRGASVDLRHPQQSTKPRWRRPVPF